MLMLVIKLLPVHICMRQNPCAWSFPISTKCSPEMNSASLCNSPTVYVDFYQRHFADMKTESEWNNLRKDSAGRAGPGLDRDV